MAQLGGQTVPKKDAAPLSDGLDSQTPLRITEFKHDILGRLIHTLARNNDKAQETAYQYDLDGNLVRTGNLTHSTDQRTGTTHFEYDKLGRITKAGNEMFAFDPAHNILSDHNSPTVPDNRLKTYNGSSYYYDCFGNLIHRELANGEVQNYFYDLYDQLVKAEIFKKDGTKETWAYTYDALGRRIGKGRLKNEEASDGLEEETRFVWDGSHLLQDGRYTYLYTDPDSYEPLAQEHNHTNTEGESRQQILYFHCDQIGIPREMTDKDGNLLWFGNYTGWGRLKEETKVTDSAYQPFRLQNQYADRETGLHYNFFRYYEPDVGRFINQDPIRLWGGNNFYQFAPNVQGWVDIFGLYNAQKCASIAARIENLKYEIYVKRIPALESNPNNLPWRIGPGEALRDTVRGHVKLLNAAYSKLAKAEKEWVDNGCDKPPPPSSPVTKCTNCSTEDKTSTNNDALTAIALVGTVVLVSVCIYSTAGVCGAFVAGGSFVGAM